MRMQAVESKLDEFLEEVKEEKERFETIKDRVTYILEKYPEARNSDLYLIICYIREFVPELSKYIQYIPYNVIKKHDGLFESIRRARQHIQNSLGLFPPTDPEVIKRRRRREKVLTKVLSEV